MAVKLYYFWRIKIYKNIRYEKKLALALSFFAFFAFGTATLQTAVAADNAVVVKMMDGEKKKKKIKRLRSLNVQIKKTSCCKSEVKKEACNDDKKADKK